MRPNFIACAFDGLLLELGLEGSNCCETDPVKSVTVSINAFQKTPFKFFPIFFTLCCSDKISKKKKILKILFKIFPYFKMFF